MPKNKTVTYLILFSLIVLAGFVFFALGKGSGKNNLASLSEKNFSFSNAVGEQAPNFKLESIDDTIVKLSDYRGKNVILFFNEGGMCYPACWNQIQQLADDERFNNDDVAVFSIVIDPKSRWEKIISETPGFSNAKILFDTTKAVSFSYDIMALESSMHPNKNPGHTYFVIDKEGIVRYVLDDPAMAIRNNMINFELAKLK